MQLRVYLILIIAISSCKEIVEINPPDTEQVITTVFSSEAKAKQAIAGLYAPLLSGFASGDVSSITYLAGLSSDELVPGSDMSTDIYSNAILPANAAILSLWTDLYKEIYNANLILKGVDLPTATISAALKQQLSGEALFMRAFSFFYLINLFGDVPLTLTTDYTINANIARTSKELVYEQIITDLKTAQQLLPAEYTSNQRVRANKWVATALLARVYLYHHQWKESEATASSIIDNNSFILCPLDKIFLTNSNEAIWQLYRDNGNSPDAGTFMVSSTNPVNGTIRPSLVALFDKNDKRKTGWIISKKIGNKTYYFPSKYKASGVSPVTEYTTIFRLSEQYLIRSEARTQLGNITDALSDLNTIRRRAGLTGSTAATTTAMMAAIENERLFELFTEWGHRWFDIKRYPSLTVAGNTRADDLLPVVGKSWQSTDTLYPIPQEQLIKDPAMTNAQNPGY